MGEDPHITFCELRRHELTLRESGLGRKKAISSWLAGHWLIVTAQLQEADAAPKEIPSHAVQRLWWNRQLLESLLMYRQQMHPDVARLLIIRSKHIRNYSCIVVLTVPAVEVEGRREMIVYKCAQPWS
jgi:hypothetical protein